MLHDSELEKTQLTCDSSTYEKLRKDLGQTQERLGTNSASLENGEGIFISVYLSNNGE